MDEIEAIRRRWRDEEANWVATRIDGGAAVVDRSATGRTGTPRDLELVASVVTDKEAQLIAAAPHDIRHLLQELDGLRK